MSSQINFKQRANTVSEKVYINNAIRAPRVLCITEDGTNIGTVETYEALRMAQASNLDLVQVSPPGGGHPPTCKILDYGKLKYDESKKRKAAEKKQREMTIEVKEIKFRPVTSTNDLLVKARKAEEFLNEGHQVKVTIVFRGRELSHKEVAFKTLDEFMVLVPNAHMLSSASMESSKALSVLLGKKS